MKEDIELLKEILAKSNKLHFALFLFITIYISVKWTSFFVENNDLNVLRNERNNLSNIILPLENLNYDYLHLCNMGYSEKEKITQLKFYLEFIKNETSVSGDYAKDLENTISFLRYIISSSIKNRTLNITLDNDITIDELLTFSNHFEYYKNFTDNISLLKEIRKNVRKYNKLTKNQKSKIIGGEDIFVGITDDFGGNLQKINNLESDCKQKIEIQANNLFYTYEDFNNLSVTQLKTLLRNYNLYIEEALKDKMTTRNMIPLLNLSVDRYLFRKVILSLIILISFLLIIETIRLKKLQLDYNLFYYNHSFILFLFFSNKIKSTFSILEKIFLISWSILNLIFPILILIAYFNFNSKSNFETIFVLMFCALFYSWLYLIYTTIIKTKN